MMGCSTMDPVSVPSRTHLSLSSTHHSALRDGSILVLHRTNHSWPPTSTHSRGAKKRRVSFLRSCSPFVIAIGVATLPLYSFAF